MIRADVITLLSEEPHGVFDQNTPQETDVFAEIRSVRQKEFYLALNEGIQPTYVFVLTDYADYGDQKLIRYNDELYDVVRTYTPVDGQTIEITVRKHEVNA